MILLLCACRNYTPDKVQNDNIPEVSSTVVPDSFEEDSVEIASSLPKKETLSTEELLKEFLDGNIMASYVDSDKEPFYITDLTIVEGDPYNYYIGDRVDLDNDGELELIIAGLYGGIYLDARDGAVYVLDEGDGTAANISYTSFDGQTWIVHSDVYNAGRRIYVFTRYDGDGIVQDTFRLTQEYWDNWEMPDGPDTVYTYREKRITREEYINLLEKMFGK